MLHFALPGASCVFVCVCVCEQVSGPYVSQKLRMVVWPFANQVWSRRAYEDAGGSLSPMGDSGVGDMVRSHLHSFMKACPHYMSLYGIFYFSLGVATEPQMGHSEPRCERTRSLHSPYVVSDLPPAAGGRQRSSGVCGGRLHA